MKSFIITIMLAAIVIGLTGCEDLDYTPSTQLSEKTFWKTEAHAREAVVGLYAAMKASWCFGMEFTFDMCSDIADGVSPWADVARGITFTSGSSGVQNHWQALYELIHRSNSVIRNIATMDISQETRDYVTGEAKFLRSMAYFRLLTLWGGVPYYDETCDINKEFSSVTAPRSTADEIRQDVIDDLTEAIDKLPVSWSAADLGRATKGAAYALRGKVYLYDKQWDKAIADFEEIVYNKHNEYGYALHTDYNDLFRLYNGRHSNEMIFSIQSIDGNTAGYALDIVSYFGNKSTMRLISSNLIVPSTHFADLYENRDGSPFDWDSAFSGFNDGGSFVRRRALCVAIDEGSTHVTSTLDCDTAKVVQVYRERDPRLCWNIITPFSHYLGTDAASKPMDKQFVLVDPTKGGSPMEAQAFIRNSEGWNSYFWRKWIPTGNLDGYWGEYNRTPYEFPLIRLGDVILMLAEAYNEVGQIDKAVTEVNKIRARVGMPGLNSGSTWMRAATQADVRQRIQDERARELAGEGHRYFDLRRWGLLSSTMKDATDIFGELMYTRAYQPRHELWPIPLVEMERNKNLTQNQGW